MKKFLLTAACAFALITASAQSTEDTGFVSRKLKLEEINFISSYYNQDGNNAAVTGGIGSQKLTDISNIIDIKLVKYDKQKRKHSFTGEIGVDHYTSASSDQVDLTANSSASYSDTRIYPSVAWSMENEKKGNTIGGGFSSSTEYDYQSFGANVSATKATKNKNTEFTGKLQYYADQVKLIIPIELRTSGQPKNGIGNAARNTFAATASVTHVLSKSVQMMLVADYIKQSGFLSLPFHRVYLTDNTVRQEKLPDTRIKVPIGIRTNFFPGDKVIIRTYYRFYSDNWGIKSHTADIELPVKINSFFSITPVFRYYTQTASNFFAPYQKHSIAQTFYTSNYDYSAFNSQFFGLGFRTAPVNGVLGNKHIKSLELRGGHYRKNVPLNANIISLLVQFK